MDTADRYEFGRNWQRYLAASFDESRARAAQDHLLDFLGVADLDGRRMVDIGCGSGIHSLGALRAGVEDLVSFDFDPDSVAATRSLHALAGAPGHWKVARGSVLDRAYLDALGRFDIVYSWGVLHHTGALWEAFDNAASMVAPGGIFYVALYDAGVASPSPEFWLAKKRRYHRGGWLTKRRLEATQIARNVAGQLRRGRNPINLFTRYRDTRGMTYMTDLRDWLGGWPMEYSTVDQVTERARRHGLTRTKLQTGEACAEYLFSRD